MAKMGLDSHYRGAIIVSRYLADRGMEVVYVGNQLPDAIVRAAVQEDVDVVGISSLSGNHLLMIPRLLEGLKGTSMEHVLVLVGGVIPPEDEERLLAAGVARVFGTGSSLKDIGDFIQMHLGHEGSSRRVLFKRGKEVGKGG